MCDFEWIGSWWGADPDVFLIEHRCEEYDDHAGAHRCACGETK